MGKTEVTLGIDIGGTTTCFGFVDREGTIHAESTIDTQGREEFEHFLPRIVDGIETLRTSLGDQIEWKGIGLGAPNANYYRGTIEAPPNLNWKGIIPVKSHFEDKFNIPVAITNDANAAALGEMKFGAAKGMRNFIVITLGTGLGSGIVVNGDVLYGHSGFAGEMGHILLRNHERKCGDGRSGCLEAYVSVTGIRRTITQLLATRNEATPLRNICFENLSGEVISKAAVEGDVIAQEAFEYTGQILGEKLADVVLITSPEAIILFGGLANAGNLIMEPTQRYLDQNLFHIFKGSVRLMFSELMNQNAAVLGASALIWHELEKSSNAS